MEIPPVSQSILIPTHQYLFCEYSGRPASSALCAKSSADVPRLQRVNRKEARILLYVSNFGCNNGAAEPADIQAA